MGELLAQGRWSQPTVCGRQFAKDWGALQMATGAIGAFRQYASSESPLSRDLWVWFEKDYRDSVVFPAGRRTSESGFRSSSWSTLDGKKLAQIWNGLMDRPSIR